MIHICIYTYVCIYNHIYQGIYTCTDFLSPVAMSSAYRAA